MSDLATLGARLRAIADRLPADETARAAQRLAEAQAALAVALRDSVEPVGAADMARSREHLDRAAAAMRLGLKRLDDYLAAIGLARLGSPDTSKPVKSSESGEVAPGGAEWWRRRINEISDGDATTKPQEVTVTKLFADLVDHARRGDRDGYRERLLIAGAATGPKLPGLSWPMVRSLAAEIFGNVPRREDREKLRAATRQTVDRLLPKLPPDVAMAQINTACSLPPEPSHPRADGGDVPSRNPVDVAAVGPALVAALLRIREQTGKDG